MTSHSAPTIVWFRQDLRVQDNPALQAAIDRGAAVIPVYIWDERAEGNWRPGGASRWWLHHSLQALDAALRERGSRLILAGGESSRVLKELIQATGASAVYWNRRYEPAAIARDKAVKQELTNRSVEAKSWNGALLHEPHTIANKSGGPFQVFTPFWRHCLTLPKDPPLKKSLGDLAAPSTWPRSLELTELELLPRIPWDAGFSNVWEPGEAAAQRRLAKFVNKSIDDYENTRNLPDLDGTSMLSPYLHFGELSPRQVWAAVKGQSKGTGVFPSSNGARVFLSEIGWREFGYHLLYHFPFMPERPLREDFLRFPWAVDPGNEKLRAWQRGRTGYPIVDAGMRQLWTTGWMHNRVRMICGSFLVKDLRLSWNHGAVWFWDTLVDADLASNTLGWQWVAGCGADASPYFRVFSPELQSRKFDESGGYIRKWVPELVRLPSEYIHAPATAPVDVLKQAGVELGRSYPPPIVDHAKARDAALAALKSLRATKPD